MVGLIALVGLSITPALLASGDGEHSDAADAAHHAVGTLSPNLTELGSDITSKVLILVMQLALILAAAKIAGWLCEKVNVPGVLGELGAGMIIGPFALGQFIPIFTHHGWVPLFPTPQLAEGVLQWPVSEVLWTIAVIASIVLLFVAGLHTNLKQFIANLGPATVIAIGGVVAPFFLGAWTTTLFMDVGMFSVSAMFVGAVMVATSVGITARVLSDINRLDTPEGVTILGGAVVDDVLGILVLAIVLGISRTGSISASAVGIIAAKAFGVWIGITALTLWLAPAIEKAFNKVTYPGARVGLGLGLAFLCSGIAESFGLAFIIGAYSVGLGLSRTKMAHQLMKDLESVNDFIVPIFFVVMGMLVNYAAMMTALTFGLVISFWGVVSKVFGCGLPALIWYNKRGAMRIGMGMLPRGEVALIIAGVGLAAGAISQAIFGVAIMMTLVTTIIAPLALVPLFKTGGPGKRSDIRAPFRPAPGAAEPITMEMPKGLVEDFIEILLGVFRKNGYAVRYDDPDEDIYQLQNGDRVAGVKAADGRITVDTSEADNTSIKKIVQQAEQLMVDAAHEIHEIPPPEEESEGSRSEKKAVLSDL